MNSGINNFIKTIWLWGDSKLKVTFQFSISKSDLSKIGDYRNRKQIKLWLDKQGKIAQKDAKFNKLTIYDFMFSIDYYISGWVKKDSEEIFTKSSYGLHDY